MSSELRYNVPILPLAPSRTSPLRQDGELFCKSDTMQLYVYNADLYAPADGDWVQVTTSQNAGSIIYSGDTPPTLMDVYPNLDVDSVDDTTALDPLPGQAWYDTRNQMLKIWYVQSNIGQLPGDENTDDNDVGAYTGQWVSVTTAHYLTQATEDLINNLQQKVDELEATVTELENIINNPNPGP